MYHQLKRAVQILDLIVQSNVQNIKYHLQEKVDVTQPSTYTKIANQTNFKYNKSKYYWYIDGYLYFPNTTWEGVRIEGVFKGSISKFSCDKTEECEYIHDLPIGIPDFLFAEIEAGVMRDLGFELQIPQDNSQDNNNTAR